MSSHPSSTPGQAPADGFIEACMASENFIVAPRVLRSRVRSHLQAIYGYARLVDELGDRASISTGERLKYLDWAEAQLEEALCGSPAHPVFVELARTMHEVPLPRQALYDLIAANRQDQTTVRYKSFEDLLGYCRLSANPVGRLVLGVLGEATAANVELSDAICTGLQLVEHCQDVAEDFAKGRIYLPMEDLRRFGVEEAMLGCFPRPQPLRDLVAYECGRARRLLILGSPLVGRIKGAARIALAGYVAGGLAAVQAMQSAGWDVERPKAPGAPPVTARPARLVRMGWTWKLVRGTAI